MVERVGPDVGAVGVHPEQLPVTVIIALKGNELSVGMPNRVPVIVAVDGESLHISVRAANIDVPITVAITSEHQLTFARGNQIVSE